MDSTKNIVGLAALSVFNGLCVLATGAVVVLAVATFVGGSGGCGNTIDVAGFALYRIAPGGVIGSLSLWKIGSALGISHPLNRTLFLTGLATWLAGILAVAVIR